LRFAEWLPAVFPCGCLVLRGLVWILRLHEAAASALLRSACSVPPSAFLCLPLPRLLLNSLRRRTRSQRSRPPLRTSWHGSIHLD
jgi:hypothetical protein